MKQKIYIIDIICKYISHFQNAKLQIHITAVCEKALKMTDEMDEH